MSHQERNVWDQPGPVSCCDDEHCVFVRDTLSSAPLITDSERMQQQHCVAPNAAPCLLSQIPLWQKSKGGKWINAFLQV